MTIQWDAILDWPKEEQLFALHAPDNKICDLRLEQQDSVHTAPDSIFRALNSAKLAFGTAHKEGSAAIYNEILQENRANVVQGNGWRYHLSGPHVSATSLPLKKKGKMIYGYA